MRAACAMLCAAMIAGAAVAEMDRARFAASNISTGAVAVVESRGERGILHRVTATTTTNCDVALISQADGATVWSATNVNGSVVATNFSESGAGFVGLSLAVGRAAATNNSAAVTVLFDK